MKKHLLAAAAAAFLCAALPAAAQNVAIVNGKPVPTARVDVLASQFAKSGRPVTPEIAAPAEGRSHRPRGVHAGSAEARPGRQR